MASPNFKNWHFFWLFVITAGSQPPAPARRGFVVGLLDYVAQEMPPPP
jgi:hypothetical protein